MGYHRKPGSSGACLLILALVRQRQLDLCEFKASMVYKVSFRTARTVTQRNSVSKTKQTKQKIKSYCKNSDGETEALGDEIAKLIKSMERGLVLLF